MPLKKSKMAPIVPLPSRTAKKLESKWITQTEVAKRLGVSNSWVSTHTSQPIDPIPHRRLLGKLQYDFEKVEEWVNKNSEYTGMEA